MNISLASLLLAAVAFGATPVFADSPGVPAPPAPGTAAPSAAAPAAGAADAGGQTEPAAEAPVPDPFLADVLKTCRDGASGDKGTFQRLQDAGWGLSVDGDTQTPFYQSFSGEKDYDGVGTVDITYSLEVYPTMTEGYCSLSIDAAQRKVGIADIKKMTDLKGDYRQTADGIASTWQDAGATPGTFIQADQHAKDLYFILDVTTLLQRPAADIPYVKPDPSADGTDDTDGGDSSDTTNAND